MLRRGALRIMSFYSTVSEPAVLVVAGVIPIELLAKEQQVFHQQKTAAHKNAGENTTNVWQQRWTSES